MGTRVTASPHPWLLPLSLHSTAFGYGQYWSPPGLDLTETLSCPGCQRCRDVLEERGASKGHVWSRHLAPAAPAFTRPSSPSRCFACSTLPLSAGSVCMSRPSLAWVRDLGLLILGIIARSRQGCTLGWVVAVVCVPCWLAPPRVCLLSRASLGHTPFVCAHRGMQVQGREGVSGHSFQPNKRGRGGGGGLEPKNLCTKNGPNQYFLLGITSQRLSDQSHAGPYIGETATYPPFWAFLGLFANPTSRG